MPDQTLRISLRKKLVRLHRSRRREKAVDYLREEVAKRMHVGLEDVRIDKDLNRLLQFRSKRMRDFSITLSKDGNKAVAKSAEQVRQKAVQGAEAKPGAAAATAPPKAGGQQKKEARKESEKKQ